MTLPKQANVVTERNLCKAVIAKMAPWHFQATADWRERKKMAKNIFLPTSEFGKSKMFLFWLNTSSSGLDCLQSSWGWFNPFYQMAVLNLLRWVMGSQAGMERFCPAQLRISYSHSSFSHHTTVSNLLQVTRAIVTTEKSAIHVSNVFRRRTNGFF